MHRPKSLTLCAFFALFSAFGCGSTSDPTSEPSSPQPAVCEAAGYYVESDATQIDHVHASIQLPSGDPASDLAVQVCGIDNCLKYTTQTNGVLDKRPQQELTRPAFKYGDGFDFAELAIPLTDAEEDLGELVTLPLPLLAQGTKFPKTGPVTNGDVTIHLESNSTVEHDLLTYSDDSELVFRSVAVPIAESTQALPPSFGFELAYGLAPLGSTFCPPAKVSLKNTLNWPPGTDAEVFVQGLDVSEKWAPYGTWLQVAEARVSSDGKSIDTTSGGIPILSSLALRRK